MLAGAHAEADAVGDIDWLVSVDSTIVRAHQHAAVVDPVGITRVRNPAQGLEEPTVCTVGDRRRGCVGPRMVGRPGAIGRGRAADGDRPPDQAGGTNSALACWCLWRYSERRAMAPCTDLIPGQRYSRREGRSLCLRVRSASLARDRRSVFAERPHPPQFLPPRQRPSRRLRALARPRSALPR